MCPKKASPKKTSLMRALSGVDSRKRGKAKRYTGSVRRKAGGVFHVVLYTEGSKKAGSFSYPSISFKTPKAEGIVHKWGSTRRVGDRLSLSLFLRNRGFKVVRSGERKGAIIRSDGKLLSEADSQKLRAVLDEWGKRGYNPKRRSAKK